MLTEKILFSVIPSTTMDLNQVIEPGSKEKEEQEEIRTINSLSRRRRREETKFHQPINIFLSPYSLYSMSTLIVTCTLILSTSRASPTSSVQQPRSLFGSLAAQGEGTVIPADQVQALKDALDSRHAPQPGTRGARASFHASPSTVPPPPHLPVSAKRVSSLSSANNQGDSIHDLRERRRQDSESRRARKESWNKFDAPTITAYPDDQELDDAGSGYGARGDDEDEGEEEGSGFGAGFNIDDEDGDDDYDRAKHNNNKNHNNKSKNKKEEEQGINNNINSITVDEGKSASSIPSIGSIQLIIVPLLAAICSTLIVLN